MSKTVRQVLALVFAIAVTTACATKGYVNEGLAEVNEKVEGLSESLEETQEQTRVNAEGVATARSEAADAAGDRADTVGRSTERLMRLLYEVVLSQDQGNFGFADAALPDAAKSEIDRLANQLKAEAPK